MQCPHCRVEIYSQFTESPVYRPGSSVTVIGQVKGQSAYWTVVYMVCPSDACKKAKFHLKAHAPSGIQLGKWLVYPKGASRPAAPPEVPENLAEDFNEACLVLA